MVFNKKRKSYGFVIYTGILALMILFFVFCIHRMENTNFDKSCYALQEATRKAAVHCYAIEGQYPESVEYLEKEYGLNYDKSRFMIHYDWMGANLVPDIFVTGSEEFYDEESE